MSDLRQSKEYANYLKSIGWKTENIDNTFIYFKKIPLLGWFAKIQRPSILNNKIVSLVKSKYHPFQFSIEPLNTNQISILKNFKLSKSPSLPTKTLVLSLTKSENEILSSFSQKTRYNIKLSGRKKINIVESKDILDFTNFWRQNFEKKRFPFFSQQKNIIAMQRAFRKSSHILLAKKNNKIIASLFLLTSDKIMYYMYAASSDDGRKYFAPTLLTWHAILLAKESSCKTFDFDGIYDERFPIKTWLGFTKFKKGFGGKEIEYPGCFIKSNSIIKI